MRASEELQNLPKEELVELIDAYDLYIQDGNDGDRYAEGWRPVCILEFYQSEFQMMDGVWE